MVVSVKAYLRVVEGKFVVEKCLDQEFCSNLLRAGLMDSNGNIELLEALHLLASAKVALEGRTGWEEALKYASMFNIRLSLLLVYHDLRRRGRRVRLGLRPNTLVLNLKSRKVEILVLEEGNPMTLEDLAEWSRSAIASGYEPVVAIVDKYGVVTYYEARATHNIV